MSLVREEEGEESREEEESEEEDEEDSEQDSEQSGVENDEGTQVSGPGRPRRFNANPEKSGSRARVAEEGDDDDDDIDSGLTRPLGVSDEDWAVFKLIDAVTTEFEAKFRAIWA